MVLSKIKHILRKDPKTAYSKFALKVSIFCLGMIIFGGSMNIFAMLINNGKMPVFCPYGKFIPSKIHSIGNEKTRLKFLCDWIFIHTDERVMEHNILKYIAKIIHFPINRPTIASPGDIIMWLFFFPTIISVTICLVLSLENIIY